jgi:hypothetical protein
MPGQTLHGQIPGQPPRPIIAGMGTHNMGPSGMPMMQGRRPLMAVQNLFASARPNMSPDVYDPQGKSIFSMRPSINYVSKRLYLNAHACPLEGASVNFWSM